jgi:hypothetical protein
MEDQSPSVAVPRGLVQPHRDPVREQVPDRHDLLARVLQRGHHAVAHRPALRRERGQGGLDPLAQLLVGLVGGQERHLVHHDHHEREFDRRGVVALLSGQLRGPGPHISDGGFEHGDDRGRVGGVLAVVVEDGPAVGQFHHLRVGREYLDQPGLEQAEQGADQGPEDGAFPGAGGPGDQQVGAVQPGQPRRAVLPAADGQGLEVGARGDGQGRDDRGEGVAADEFEDQEAGPGRADPAEQGAEPVGQVLGPGGEVGGGLAAGGLVGGQSGGAGAELSGTWIWGSS